MIKEGGRYEIAKKGAARKLVDPSTEAKTDALQEEQAKAEADQVKGAGANG